MGKTAERLIGVGFTIVICLGTFWIGTLASDKDILQTNSKVEYLTTNVKNNYATKLELKNLENKIDIVISRLDFLIKQNKR